MNESILMELFMSLMVKVQVISQRLNLTKDLTNMVRAEVSLQVYQTA